MQPLEPQLTRASFLRFSIKTFALTSLTLSGVDCIPARGLPALKGVSQQEYLNMKAVGDVFLTGCPIPDFDLGVAMDNYVFGHPSPIDTKNLVLELAGAPSSTLASLVLDGSFTPLVKLPRAERETRMLGWKNSDNEMKRGLFNILRQTTFFLLSSHPDMAKFAGYATNAGFIPYGK